jgi:uroporphyrinogen decarboxylase
MVHIKEAQKMKSRIHELFESVYCGTIPVIPLVGIHSAHISAINVHEALTDGNLMAKAELSALNQYGYDGILTFMDLTLEAEALGCEVQYHAETVPSVKRTLFNDAYEYACVKSSRLEESTRLSEFLRAVEIMAENIDHSKTILGAYVTGPFTLAGQLMGMESLFENMVLHPDAFSNVLEKTVDITITMVDKYVKKGVDFVVVLEPIASPDLISPLHFNQFVKPHLKHIVKNSGVNDVLLVLHICGNTTQILKSMLECGYDALSIDSKVEMEYAACLVKDTAVLMGNVDPVDVLLNGTPEDVKKASVSCLTNSLEAPFFILSSGCEIPKNTPPRNVKKMVKTAKEYE